MRTERLEICAPTETDRNRFVELFTDTDFMVFSGVLTIEEANQRFDSMVAMVSEIPFAKQPLFDQQTSKLIGYAGVDWFEYEGQKCLEFGHRLVRDARGKGYATEAGLALLDVARKSYVGTVYLLVQSTNSPSIRVAGKLGFEFWKEHKVENRLYQMHVIELP